MSKTYIKPKDDKIIVLDPYRGTALPAEGDYIALDNYWRRRLKDGDVVLSEPPKKTKKPSKTGAKS